MKYRIVRMRPKGINRYGVFLGKVEVASFYLKKHAIDWILAQEAK